MVGGILSGHSDLAGLYVMFAKNSLWSNDYIW